MFRATDAVAYTAGLQIQHLPFGCDAEGLVDGCGCTVPGAISGRPSILPYLWT